MLSAMRGSKLGYYRVYIFLPAATDNDIAPLGEKVVRQAFAYTPRATGYHHCFHLFPQSYNCRSTAPVVGSRRTTCTIDISL